LHKIVNQFNILNLKKIIKKKYLGLGIGDWGLGIGDWGLGPIPNPQSPIPNPQSFIFLKINLIYNLRVLRIKEIININTSIYKKNLLMIIIPTIKHHFINKRTFALIKGIWSGKSSIKITTWR